MFSNSELLVNTLLKTTRIAEFSLIALSINIGVFLFAALIEICTIGWKKSSLNRIMFKRSNSTNGDLWCWIMSILNIYDLFVIIFSFGFFYVVTSIMFYNIGEYNLINLIHSTTLQLIIIFILSDIKHYFWHWFMHKNPFWELHKYHHSANELNLITTTRGHFIEKGILTVFDAVLFLLFGLDVEYYVIIAFAREFYSYLLHSGLNWRLGWFGKYVLISPVDHRIHHSKSKDHFDKNFGTFFIWWDKIFGTYIYTSKKIDLGIENSNYNKKGFWKEMIIGTNEFVNAVFNMKLKDIIIKH